MLPDLGTPLLENNGFAMYELYSKVEHNTYTQWGFIVTHPDQTFNVFTDKVAALQHLDNALNDIYEAPPLSPGEKILQEDMTSSPSTSSLITND